MTVLRRTILSIALLGTLAACGGSSNPLGNPPVVSNPEQRAGNQHLSFAYFQKCINPIFLAQLQIQGTRDHQHLRRRGLSRHGDGHRRRSSVVTGAAQPVDCRDPANTPDVIRASDIYKNFYSAQGEVIVGNAAQSRLLAKPLLLGVLHGGGLIFAERERPQHQADQVLDHPSGAARPGRVQHRDLHHVHAGRSEDRHVQHPVSAAAPMRPRHRRGDAMSFPLRAARTWPASALALLARRVVRRRRTARAPASPPRRPSAARRPRRAAAAAVGACAARRGRAASAPLGAAVARAATDADAALAQVGAGADQRSLHRAAHRARAAAIRSSSSRRATSGSRSSCATPTGSASAPRTTRSAGSAASSSSRRSPPPAARRAFVTFFSMTT